MIFFGTKFNCMRRSCSLNRMLRYWRNVPDRARSHESIGRRLHQRPASPKSHSLENRRNGSGWGASLRDIAAAPRFSRLRIENIEPLPGNWFHQAGRDRWQQAEGSHPWDRGEDRRNEEGQSWDLLVGDQGEIGEGKRWLIWRHESEKICSVTLRRVLTIVCSILFSTRLEYLCKISMKDVVSLLRIGSSTTCAGNWLRTITSDQTVYNNSSLSFWTRRYDITG